LAGSNWDWENALRKVWTLGQGEGFEGISGSASEPIRLGIFGHPSRGVSLQGFIHGVDPAALDFENVWLWPGLGFGGFGELLWHDRILAPGCHLLPQVD